MKTNKLLVAVIALQGLILIGQWSGGTAMLSTAHGQIPDPANRQMQMIDELKSLNSKLDQVIGILKDGDLQVRVAKTEEEKGTPRAK